MPIYPWMVIPVLAALFILYVFWRLAHGTRSKLKNAKTAPLSKISGEGTKVPLVAAFGGWKSIPWIVSTSSNIAPLLVLYETDFEYRVIRRKRRRYTDISNVDLRTAWRTVNVVLEFHGSIRSFVGNTANQANAVAALKILESKGCPLSERARAALQG